MNSIVLTIGVIGSVASIIGLLLGANGFKERLIHAIYGFIISILASGFVYYQNSLAEITKIEKQATNLMQNNSKESIGSKRGFILATLAFLEKNKLNYPDTYKMAKQLAFNVDILNSKEDDTIESINQGRQLSDVADAMEKLLEGISGKSRFIEVDGYS